MATAGKVIKLDVLDIMPWDRHPKIFETFDGMKPGETLELVNDHDPRPLHYQFMVERKDQFEWTSAEKGQRHWVATIKKLK